MKIPLSAIEPFGVTGIPLLNKSNARFHDAKHRLDFIVNMVADGMVEDIQQEFCNNDILKRAALRAEVCGAVFIRTRMSQGSHGIDFMVMCRVIGSTVIRRARAFKAN